MANVRVKDTDRGYRKLLQRLTDGKKPVVAVGIMGQEAAAEHKGAVNATVADVATFHEFGLGVPERSFIRSWADENKDRVVLFLKRELERAIKSGDSFEVGLERLGLFCQSGIQKRISDGGPYEGGPLAESTIRRKGSSVPLIDTGQLRSSITYKVDMDGGSESK